MANVPTYGDGNEYEEGKVVFASGRWIWSHPSPIHRNRARWIMGGGGSNGTPPGAASQVGSPYFSTVSGLSGIVRGKWECIEWTFSTVMPPNHPDPMNDHQAGNVYRADQNYRFNLSCTSPAGDIIRVPGFYAGDGVGGGTGNCWKVRFAPSATGQWSATIGFDWRADPDNNTVFAVQDPSVVGTTLMTPLNGSSFVFTVSAHDTAGSGFIPSGLIRYVEGSRYFSATEGGPNNYFLKTGFGSPENFLAYKGFDRYKKGSNPGTNLQGILHEYDNHKKHYRGEPLDPMWRNAAPGGDQPYYVGPSGIIGALNYLADNGCNALYAMVMNLGGDGQDVFPTHYTLNGSGDIIRSGDRKNFDVVRNEQWFKTLKHAQDRGIFLDLYFAEREQPNVIWYDSGGGQGTFGDYRKLLYRQIVAMFGCFLGIKWNLCEECSAENNNSAIEYTYAQLKAMGTWLYNLDYHHHPITISIDRTDQNGIELYRDLTNATHWGDVSGWLNSTAYQITNDTAGRSTIIPTTIGYFRDAVPSRVPVIDLDEQNPPTGFPGVDEVRRSWMFTCFFAEGAGIDWYIGSRDQSLEDFSGETETNQFTDLSALWIQSRYARNYMYDCTGGYWDYSAMNHVVTASSTAALVSTSQYGGHKAFGHEPSGFYNVFYPINASASNGGFGVLNLSGTASATFEYKWWNPAAGTYYTTPSGVIPLANVNHNVSATFGVPHRPGSGNGVTDIVLKVTKQ